MKTSEHRAVIDLIEEALGDPESGFSIGVSGAIAEFLRSDGEAEWRRSDTSVTATTGDGGMRVALEPGVVAVAAELPSRSPDHWQQQIAFCLPQFGAAMGGRQVLTELGRDAEAIEASGKDRIRFDLGLGIAHVEACVSSGDPELIALLRRFEGRRLLTDAPEARDAVIAASPTRVFCSRLGRIEVRSPIPERTTPEGPHTHLLPKLLGRPSPIADFIPAGYVSCLDLYPANPLRTAAGKTRAFDSERHARFQRALASWAPVDYVEEKRRVGRWLRDGRSPSECPPAKGALAEIARRVALRQSAFEGVDAALLRSWRQAIDSK